MDPKWATLLNALFGVFGVLESTGVTNVLTSSGGKAGAVAATVIAVGNFLAHGFSTNAAGPFAPMPSVYPTQGGFSGNQPKKS
jgi:hypothetical protein